MAFITAAQAVRGSRTIWSSARVAESQIAKSAATAPITADFDIFMSHSYEDAEVIGGLKVLLEQAGFSVYVDWIQDAQLDRSTVTAATADMLRQRMKHCRHLLYATSKASANSKWMPWELGYFDGLRSGHVGILPIVETATDPFNGLEYLALYPAYELLDFSQYGKQFGRRVGLNEGELLRTDGKHSGPLVV